MAQFVSAPHCVFLKASLWSYFATHSLADLHDPGWKRL